jgi:hypothetical protein
MKNNKKEANYGYRKQSALSYRIIIALSVTLHLGETLVKQIGY